MAKLTAPLMSMEAAGKLGDSLIIQSWRGRFYARRLTNPKAARTPTQRGLRAAFAHLPAIFKTLPQALQDWWDDDNSNSKITAMSHFTNSQMTHLSQGKPLYPDPGGILTPVAPDDHDYDLDVGTRGNRFYFTNSGNWGTVYAWALYRTELSFPPSYVTSYISPSDLTTSIVYLPTTVEEYTDTDVEDGVNYLYCPYQFSESGNKEEPIPGF